MPFVGKSSKIRDTGSQISALARRVINCTVVHVVKFQPPVFHSVDLPLYLLPATAILIVSGFTVAVRQYHLISGRTGSTPPSPQGTVSREGLSAPIVWGQVMLDREAQKTGVKQ